MDNQIAVTDTDVKTALKTWADADLAYFLPNSEKLRGFMKSAALCIFEQPSLRACLTTDQGRVTLLRALQKAASTGLSLNPQEGKAALVAIQGRVEYWPMKNGLIELAHETEKVEYLGAEIVYEKDSFSLKKTAHGDDYDFSPALRDRGAPILYFAVLALKTGRSIVKMMTEEQMQAWKKKYGKGLDKTNSMWVSNYAGAALKTMLKRVLSETYLGPSLQKALDLDDAQEREENDVTPSKIAIPETVADELRGKTNAKTVEGTAEKIDENELF